MSTIKSLAPATEPTVAEPVATTPATETNAPAKKKVVKVPHTILCDEYEAHGSTLEGLRNFIKDMNKRTTFVKAHSADIELLSFRCKERGGATVASYRLTPQRLLASTPDVAPKMLKKVFPIRRAGCQELADEWTERSKLALIVNDNDPATPPTKREEFYLLSEEALVEMDRFGMAGSFLRKPCFERDMMIAKAFEEDLGVTLVVRAVGATKKVFSILSDKYSHINQLFLLDVVKALAKDGEMGTPVCHHWTATNFCTNLFVEFPDKAQEFQDLYHFKKAMIPGIMLSTSDTGDSSLRICGTWRLEGNDTVTLHSEVHRKHSGKIELEKILNDVSEQIFAEYAKIPQALCELMLVDITNPDWDLSTAVHAKANGAEIDTSLKVAFKNLGVVGAIGKKSEKNLREQLMRDFNSTIHYTAYDIAINLMALPERLAASKKNLNALQKACAKAPFIAYKANNKVEIID